MEEDNTQYYNDEWNKEDTSTNYSLVIFFEGNFYKLSEWDKENNKPYIIKNNKPDGRRYKK